MLTARGPARSEPAPTRAAIRPARLSRLASRRSFPRRRLKWSVARGRRRGFGRRRFTAEFRKRLGELEPLGRRLHRGRRRADVLPPPQEGDDLTIFLAGQIGLVSHVADRHVIVAEWTFAERPGVVARAAVHASTTARPGAHSSSADDSAPGRIDRQVFPQVKVPRDCVRRRGLAASWPTRACGDRRRDECRAPPRSDSPRVNPIRARTIHAHHPHVT